MAAATAVQDGNGAARDARTARAARLRMVALVGLSLGTMELMECRPGCRSAFPLRSAPITVDSYRRKDDVGATLVVALLPADVMMRKPGNQMGAPTAGNVTARSATYRCRDNRTGLRSRPASPAACPCSASRSQTPSHKRAARCRPPFRPPRVDPRGARHRALHDVAARAHGRQTGSEASPARQFACDSGH